MRLTRSLPLLAVVAVAAVVLAACGGGPSSPSSEGVTLSGTVLNATGLLATSRGGVRAMSSADVITVTVQGTSITTTVGADGSFTLRGLPTGSFTLVFTSGGATLGTVTLDGVAPNQEITITVRMDAGTVTVVDEHRNGIGHGDVEVEGDVQTVVTASLDGDSRFVIDGKTVVARPGQTAIRQGNRARTALDLTVGTHVHVKGTYQAMEGTVQPILASEIIIQGNGNGGGGGDNPGNSACMIEGGKVGQGIELEGNVSSGGPDTFSMDVSGNRASGLVTIHASGASFTCNGGPNPPTGDACRATVKSGAQVHVSGSLTSCDPSHADVDASKVKVQK